MKFAIASFTAACVLCGILGPASVSAVPKDNPMNVEPLKVALSKIAPLETWDTGWSRSGPRICFELFRPDPQQDRALLQIVSSFVGFSRWHFIDDCLAPGAALTAFPEGTTLLSSPTGVAVEKQMTEAEINSDLAKMAVEIEQRLGLHDKVPKSFSQTLLTKEGLRQSHGPFEDFQDGGQRIVYLIVNPGSSQVFQATDADIMLHFEPEGDEMTAIFGDLLGTDLFRRDFHTMTEAEADRLQKTFPGLWSIEDYNMGAYLTPQQASLLYQECLKIGQSVTSPKAIRGIDKLTRIAYWASTKHYGIFFESL
jgi:hypothetical protein